MVGGGGAQESTKKQLSAVRQASPKEEKSLTGTLDGDILFWVGLHLMAFTFTFYYMYICIHVFSVSA